jgi:hypothetical protein
MTDRVIRINFSKNTKIVQLQHLIDHGDTYKTIIEEIAPSVYDRAELCGRCLLNLDRTTMTKLSYWFGRWFDFRTERTEKTSIILIQMINETEGSDFEERIKPIPRDINIMIDHTLRYIVDHRRVYEIPIGLDMKPGERPSS